MIDSIQASSMSQGNNRLPPPLTSEQQTLISDVLSLYEPEKLTQEDANEIVNLFSEAGISPGKQLEELMAAQGFDAKSVGELAGVEKRKSAPPPPKPPSADLNVDQLVDFLEELMADKVGGSLSDEDKLQIYEELSQRFGIEQGEQLVSIKV